MKAVVLAAGLGTRLIPYSKEMPKEMLPIFSPEAGRAVLKPILQVVFEQLYDAGIREFCFIVGRGKRTVEDHFTPDWSYVEFLKKKGKVELAEMLGCFYKRVEDSSITWVNQPVPKGTGDAVLRAQYFAQNGYFVVAAGDNVFIGRNVAEELLKLHNKLGGAVMAVKRVENPSRYGVVVGEIVGKRIIRVRRIVEKPRIPPSNLANTSLYVLPPETFRALKQCGPSPRGEIELTDALQMLVDWGHPVYAYDVGDAYWVDVGTPRTYLDALLLSLKVSGDADILLRAEKILGSRPPTR